MQRRRDRPAASARPVDAAATVPRRRAPAGRPPEENENVSKIIPRLEGAFVARQQQRMTFGETLCTGGERYPLMENKRMADLEFRGEDGRPAARTLRSSISAPALLAPGSHWSMRLAHIPTHSTLSRGYAKLGDLKARYHH